MMRNSLSQATELLFILGWAVRWAVALNNITLIMLGKQMPTPVPLIGKLEISKASDEDLSSFFKFHVSGQLDSGFVRMAKSFKGNPHLNKFSTMLDAKVMIMYFFLGSNPNSLSKAGY